MATIRTGLRLLATAMVVTSCTDTPLPAPPPPVAMAAPRPARPVPIDGAYNATMQLVMGPAISCGSQDQTTMTVTNNAFHYNLAQPQIPWQPVRSFNVIIAPGGAFQAQSGTASIRGNVSAGHMSGDIVGDACSYHFEADRSGTW